jgi:hypothetical protein
MGKINRRSALAVTGAGLTAALTGVQTSVAASVAHDPVIDAVKAYRDGMAAFNALHEDDWSLHGGEDAVIHKTYGAPLEVLDEWDQPIMTREGAIAALRFVVDENAAYWASDGVGAMVKAALGYLERETV